MYLKMAWKTQKINFYPTKLETRESVWVLSSALPPHVGGYPTPVGPENIRYSGNRVILLLLLACFAVIALHIQLFGGCFALF